MTFTDLDSLRQYLKIDSEQVSLGFYKRRKTDLFVGGLISSTKELIAEAEKILDSGIIKS